MSLHRFLRHNRRKPLPSPPPIPTPAAVAAGDDLDRGDNHQNHSHMFLRDKEKRSPRLDRTKAERHIDYTALEARRDENKGSVGSSGSGRSSGSGNSRSSRLSSPDFSAEIKSFRIDGETEGQVEFLYESLGLSGPDDFGIPVAAWEERKVRSSAASSSSTYCLCSPSVPDFTSNEPKEEEEKTYQLPPERPSSVTDRVGECHPAKTSDTFTNLGASDGLGRGWINGVRPLTLAAFPRCLPPLPPKSVSVSSDAWDDWDSANPFAPRDKNIFDPLRGSMISLHDSGNRTQEDDERANEQVKEEFREAGFCVPVNCDLTGSSSFTTTTSIDDDCSSTTTEPMYVMSPNGRWKRNIGTWYKGKELGRGSYGTVYEAISDDGVFFAVKEVSLLDQANDAKQCIEQLEQEIALLSELEHENIVQYLGTEKEEGKLYIFLELVTQGSLASLYHNYKLRDSHVSAYTRQILNGLKYLHNRNVVHRDIKCANILVAANGSIKLADFGLAKEKSRFGMLKSCKGSVFWMAPEVANHKKSSGYGSAADIWSLGCTVLEMLTRKPPYHDLEWMQVFFKIGSGQGPEVPESLSRYARDFICQCIQIDPHDRPTASQLLEHPFVWRQLPTPFSSDSSSHGRLGRNG